MAHVNEDNKQKIGLNVLHYISDKITNEIYRIIEVDASGYLVAQSIDTKEELVLRRADLKHYLICGEA